MRSTLVAIGITGLVLILHALFQIQLISVVIAPFVLAIWIALMPEPPKGVYISLIILAELTSQTPPGVMTSALLVPLLARSLLKSIPVGFTVRFAGVVLAISLAQMAIVVSVTSYLAQSVLLPWPAGFISIIGSGLTAFLICIVWYELTTRFRYS